MHSSSFAATDFKTLYASTASFVSGHDAYSFPILQKVFQSNNVVLPPSWFAHAPVYPPTTLALLAPLALLPMVPAAWCVIAGSSVLLALAVFALLQFAENELHLPVVWRIVLAGLCAAPQVISFALTVGNVSVAAASLALIAFLHRQQGSIWSNAVLLALALLLKPHVALWMAVTLLLLPESRSRQIVLRSLAVVAGFSAFVALVLTATGRLHLQVGSFLQMLRDETARGASMSPSSHELVTVAAQITSLRSLIGFWTSNAAFQQALTLALLLLGTLILFRHTRRLRWTGDAPLIAAGWGAFGLMATYHRAHDAVLLLILLPWILASIRNSPKRWLPWAMLLFCALASSGFDIDSLSSASRQSLATHPFALFLCLRQAPLCIFLLFLLLLKAPLDTKRHDAGEIVNGHAPPL